MFVGLVVASVGAWYDDGQQAWTWVVLVAALAAAVGLEFWERRSVTVVTRAARGYRRTAMGITGGGSVLVAGFAHPPYAVVVAVAAVPCLVAAWLVLRRGRE